MKEVEHLKSVIEKRTKSNLNAIKRLNNGIEKVKVERQEQTGKPYHQQ